jgi:hypothetical protein
LNFNMIGTSGPFTVLPAAGDVSFKMACPSAKYPANNSATVAALHIAARITLPRFIVLSNSSIL